MTGDETRLVALKFSRRTELAAELARAWEKGYAGLPIDASLGDSEVALALGQFRPHALREESGETKLEGAKPVASEVAFVVPTSGTSGPPKGVELSRSALEFAADSGRRFVGYDLQERWLCCLPVNLIGGLMILVRSWVAGTSPIIHESFDQAAIGNERSASLISLVPTALARLLDAEMELSSFSAVLLGGGPIPPSLVERAADKGLTVICTYGMTETCGGCVYDGRPLEGVQVRVAGGGAPGASPSTVEENSGLGVGGDDIVQGEIFIGGALLMNGYRLAPNLTRLSFLDGLLRTGDSGAISADGRITVEGRLDDMIISGGRNISPERLEAILAEHPALIEAGVVGIPDEEWGQSVTAALVSVDEETRPGIQDVRKFVGERLGRSMAPREIFYVDSLPRTATGKLQRRLLRERIMGDRP